MKRWIVFVLSLIFVLTLAGCNQNPGPDSPVVAYIGDSTTTVFITHIDFIGMKPTQWEAEGEDVENLRDWVSKLECELLEAEEGQTPGNSDSRAEYDFEFIPTEGDYPVLT